MRTETAYDDAYATCESTFAWLRVMSEDLQSDSVTSLLGIAPTHTQLRGEQRSPASTRQHKYSGWFLESESHVESRDARRHLDWLLAQLQGKAGAIATLKRQGNLVDVCVRWNSYGHGGPTLNAQHMAQLGELGIELWFDIYFVGRDSAG